MPADTNETVAEHSTRLQPSIKLHDPITAFMFSCSGTDVQPRWDEDSGKPCAAKARTLCVYYLLTLRYIDEVFRYIVSLDVFSIGLKTSGSFRKFPGKFPETWKVSTAKFPESFLKNLEIQKERN